MSHLIDLVGQRFDRLVVVEKMPPQNNVLTSWLCRCDCGVEKIVTGPNLKTGRQKSCGCKNAERILKHGASVKGKKDHEYRAWRNIKKRCYYEKDRHYYMYGGAGITVCDRWLNSFENFLEDMGRRPSPKHSIDRIDGKKGYSPENCKWSTASEQIINQRLRDDNTSGYKGVSWAKNMGKWHAYIKPGINEKRITLGHFNELSDAIEARKKAELTYRALAN